MKIKALCKIRTDVQTLHEIGEVFDINDEEGKRLTELKVAELVKESEKTKEISVEASKETAVEPSTEAPEEKPKGRRSAPIGSMKETPKDSE